MMSLDFVQCDRLLQKAYLRTFDCRGSLLWAVADKLFFLSSKSVPMAFKSLDDMSSQNVYDFSSEQKALVWLSFVRVVKGGEGGGPLTCFKNGKNRGSRITDIKISFSESRE